VAAIAAKSIAKSQQSIGVTSSAEINSTAIIRVCLHLSLPESGNKYGDQEWDAPESLQLIQQSDILVKISPQYDFNDDSSFLLITNPETPPDLIDAIKYVIVGDLHLKVDQWNLGEHGGYQFPIESPGETPRSIISLYISKTIIFLSNDFDYFGQGPRNALQLCDVTEVAQSSLEGTSSLFLGCGEKKQQEYLESFVFPVNHRLQDLATFIKETSHFSTRKELFQAINQQQTVDGARFTTFTLLVKPSIRGGKEETTRKEAESIAEGLREQMPQERFMVSHLHPLSSIMDDNVSVTLPGRGRLVRGDRDFGLVVVFRGLPNGKSIRMAACHPVQQVRVKVDKEQMQQRVSSLGQVKDRPTTKATLDPFDAYMVISSLPLSIRISILFGHSEGKQDTAEYSVFVQEACQFSVIEDHCSEVAMLLDHASIVDSLSLKKLPDAEILKLHFSRLATLLRHPGLKACDTIPDRVLTVLQYTLAAAFPTKKRHMVSSQRSQVRSFLVKVIDEVLKRKGLDDNLAEFHTRAKKDAPNLQSTMAKELSKLTKKPQREYEKSKCDTQDIVKETIYSKSRDWDLRVAAMEKSRDERSRLLAKARDVLGEMTAL
jgi:hypothetical protein